MKAPLLLIFAGTNGAGKSSLYERLISLYAPEQQESIVNPDRFALQLAKAQGYNSVNELPKTLKEQIDIQAGRLALAKRHELIAKRTDLIVETTASSTSLLRLMNKAHSCGYTVSLILVTLGLCDLHLKRISTRVAAQGHHIPTDTVQRRYERAWELFPKLITQADQAILFDNSATLSRILVKDEHGLTVNHAALSKLNHHSQARLNKLLAQASQGRQEDKRG